MPLPNPPNQPPAGGKDAWTRDQMQKIARLVDEELPSGWGFVIFAFPFAGGDGRTNYVSNSRAEDVDKLLQEFLQSGGAKGGHR